METSPLTVQVVELVIGGAISLIIMTVAIVLYLERGFRTARHGNDNRTQGIINTIENQGKEIRELIDRKYEAQARDVNALRSEIYRDQASLRERIAALEQGSKLAEAIDRLVEAKIARN